MESMKQIVRDAFTAKSPLVRFYARLTILFSIAGIVSGVLCAEIAWRVLR